MATQNPTLIDIIEAAIGGRMSGHWTALPGAVESYDASTQTCSVQPQIQQAYKGEDGARIVERLPVINSVPVVFPGGGGYRMTCPVKSGDTCLLVFMSASTDKWQTLGTEVDPGDDRKNTLAHAVAFVGLNPPSTPLSSAPTDMMSIGKDDGLVIEIDNNEIRIGGASAGFVVLASPYRTREDAVINALISLVAALNTAHAPSGPYPDVGTASACATATAALNAFIANASSYVSQFGKVW